MSENSYSRTKMLLSSSLYLLALVQLSFCANKQHEEMAFNLVRWPLASNYHTRGKRSVKNQVNETVKRELIDLHNKYRKGLGASNMNYLNWNEDLASLAQEWANNCKMQRYNGPYPGPSSKWRWIGQNMKKCFQLGIAHQVSEWGDVHYNHDTGSCMLGCCTHYTQIVWAETHQFACAAARYPYCKLPKLEYIICIYAPGGNYVGMKPYKKGPPCSECEAAFSWCIDGLCVSKSQCDKSLKCKCVIACHNCARFNPESCSCTCDKGWKGARCTEKCEENDSECETSTSTKQCEPVGPGSRGFNAGKGLAYNPTTTFLAMLYIFIVIQPIEY